MNRNRIVDFPPKPRNAHLARIMRRMNLREESGTGWNIFVVFSGDKCVRLTERKTSLLNLRVLERSDSQLFEFEVSPSQDRNTGLKMPAC